MNRYWEVTKRGSGRIVRCGWAKAKMTALVGFEVREVFMYDQDELRALGRIGQTDFPLRVGPRL